MKKIYQSCFLLITAAILYACSGRASATSGNSQATSADGGSGDSTYSGTSHLLYTIAGRKVDIRDNLKTGGKNWIALFLNEVSHKTADHLIKIDLTNYLTKEVFNFVVDEKGTTRFSHYQPNLGNFRGKGATYMGHYVNYYADDVQVTINIADDKHVTGTFSGQFKSDDGKTIQVSDGQFDVLFKNE